MRFLSYVPFVRAVRWKPCARGAATAARLLVVVVVAMLVWHGMLSVIYVPKLVSDARNVSGYFHIPVRMLRGDGLHFILDHPQTCGGGRRLHVVALIVSAPRNHANRDTIRATWGAALRRRHGDDDPSAFLFVLGDPRNASLQAALADEDRRHGDLIQADFIDSYFNMTLKHLVALRWAVRRCRGDVSFVLKTDDDVVVNTHRLLPYLSSLPATDEALLCYVNKNPRVFRDETKWRISRALYAAATYPDYCAGPAYVVTPRVAARLFDATLAIRPMFVDDVLVSGIARLHAGVRLMRAPYQLRPADFTMWEPDPLATFARAAEDGGALPMFGALQGYAGDNKTDVMRAIWDVIEATQRRRRG
ncbi:PREDICTED: lactosylceramide 1,3-N-acetyl-beta-D-glucosaminyltransferase-like [Priapulus caudatus]|uniref:Hexosyltransferase n=1 Tax=Priapulus caudatus TaxID=37621 RepID=A0ABM1F040_PRICU|nr:PREDICTED: lactosylceramide 1,3-N-acetyl-beta-D-glucosaminyltransferase-like [Priapulus caudatus]